MELENIIKENLEKINSQLEEIKKIMKPIIEKYEEMNEKDRDKLFKIKVSSKYSDESEKVKGIWEETEKRINNLPSYILILMSEDLANLRRHINFNEFCDWVDIYKRDIPGLKKILEDYLEFINFISELKKYFHPKIKDCLDLFFKYEIDKALKSMTATLEAYIRNELDVKDPKLKTYNEIAVAFNKGKLEYRITDYNEAIRNFLQGVIGFYRNFILHNSIENLVDKKMMVVIKRSIMIACVVNEAFYLIDQCLGYARDKEK